ncbi:hypothetical protein MMC13_001081 [Lambiella insularis]|nr:hypothetical protein [Lambiella insularis]
MDSAGNAKSDDLLAQEDHPMNSEGDSENQHKDYVWDFEAFQYDGALGEGSKDLLAFDAEFGINHKPHELEPPTSTSSHNQHPPGTNAPQCVATQGNPNSPVSRDEDTVAQGFRHQSEPVDGSSPSATQYQPTQLTSSQAPKTTTYTTHTSAAPHLHSSLHNPGLSRLLSGQSPMKQLNKPSTSSPLARAVTTNADILASLSRRNTTATPPQLGYGPHLSSATRMHRSATSASAPEMSFDGADQHSSQMSSGVHMTTAADHLAVMNMSNSLHISHMGKIRRQKPSLYPWDSAQPSTSFGYISVNHPLETTGNLNSQGVYWQEGARFDENVQQMPPAIDAHYLNHSTRGLYGGNEQFAQANSAISPGRLPSNGVNPYAAQIYGQPGQPIWAAQAHRVLASDVKQEQQLTYPQSDIYNYMGSGGNYSGFGAGSAQIASLHGGNHSVDAGSHNGSTPKPNARASRGSRVTSHGGNKERFSLDNGPFALLGSVEEPQTQPGNTQVRVRFQSLIDFDGYIERRKDSRGFEEDETYPHTPEKERVYVKLFIAAMNDMTGANDKPLMIDMWDKLKKDEHLVEDSAWNLLHEKTICKHVVAPAYNPGFVDDPTGAAQRVINNRKVNESKKVAIEKGRDALSRANNGQTIDDSGYPEDFGEREMSGEYDPRLGIFSGRGSSGQPGQGDARDQSLEAQPTFAKAYNAPVPFSNTPDSTYDTPESSTQASRNRTGSRQLVKASERENSTIPSRRNRRKSRAEEDDDATYQPSPTPKRKKTTRSSRYPLKQLPNGKFTIETIPSPPHASGLSTEIGHSERFPNASDANRGKTSTSQSVSISRPGTHGVSAMGVGGLPGSPYNHLGQYDGSMGNPFSFGQSYLDPGSSYVRDHQEAEGGSSFFDNFGDYMENMSRDNASSGPSYSQVSGPSIPPFQHVDSWRDRFVQPLGGTADPFDDASAQQRENEQDNVPEDENEDDSDDDLDNDTNETGSEYIPSGH